MVMIVVEEGMIAMHAYNALSNSDVVVEFVVVVVEADRPKAVGVDRHGDSSFSCS
jgi:hypothetical protein